MYNMAVDALFAKSASPTKDAEAQESSQNAGPSCGQLMLARVWGSAAAILVMVAGFLNIITCLQWAIYMMCVGFITLILEASFIAGLFDCSEAFSDLLGRCRPWQKAVFYCLASLPPLIGCFGITMLVACVAWFATGIGYGMMFLSGRKKSPHTVRYDAGSDEAKATLMGDVEQGNDKEDEPDTTETSSAWWPFSTRQEPASGKLSAAAATSAKVNPSPATEPPKPVMTGALPDTVPAAFPKPTLGGGSPQRTVAYTGPVKPVVAVPPPVAVAPAQPSDTRTVAYTGPLLKPIGGDKVVF